MKRTNIVTCDWLAVNYLCKRDFSEIQNVQDLQDALNRYALEEELATPENYVMGISYFGLPKYKVREYGSKTFTYIVDVYVKTHHSMSCVESEVLLCTLSLLPRSNVLNARLCTCKIANFMLYLASRHELVSIMSVVERHFALRYHNLARVDMCCDTTAPLFPIADLISGIVNRTIIRSSKNPMGKTQVVYDRHMTAQYLRLGAHGSLMSAYIYDKTAELQESGKQYIRRYWEKNELVAPGDTLTRVWRFEVSLKNEMLKRLSMPAPSGTPREKLPLYRFHLESFADVCEFVLHGGAYFLDFWQLLYVRNFDFRHADNVRTARCTRIVIFDNFCQSCSVSLPAYRETTLETKRTARVVVGYLERLKGRKIGLRFADEKQIDEMIREVTGIEGLTDWYIRRCESGLYDIHRATD